MSHAQFILASGSARRRELLDQMGLRYTVQQADIAEHAYPGEAPVSYVERVAREKACWVATRAGSGLPVLAADTEVVLGGTVLGKPANSAAAKDMLTRLSGRTHEVFTAVVLIAGDETAQQRLSRSRVTFAPLEPDWIAAYCSGPEPLDKAGAYAIQGLAAQWIVRLEGSYSGVMGLPIYETMQLLREAGVHAAPPINVK